MNQPVGHLGPEPHRWLPHLHPSLSKPRQSSAGQGGQRQFPFLLSAFASSKEPEEGEGGEGSQSTSPVKARKQGLTHTEQMFGKSLILLVVKEPEGGRKLSSKGEETGRVWEKGPLQGLFSL